MVCSRRPCSFRAPDTTCAAPKACSPNRVAHFSAARGQNAAGASCLPVPFACIGTSFWRVDRPKPPDGRLSSSHVGHAPGFFRTLAVSLIEGRDFASSDTVDTMPVAIVGQELVRQQFPDGSPLGRRLRVNVDHANGRSDVEWTIVGVVGNTRSTLDGPVRQTVFVPRSQRPGVGITFFVHAHGQDRCCWRPPSRGRSNRWKPTRSSTPHAG